MAIVYVGGCSTASLMTEVSREFLEYVSALGRLLPLFIVWQRKSHCESYYSEGWIRNEATFAVSESDYMDDKMN